MDKSNLNATVAKIDGEYVICEGFRFALADLDHDLIPEVWSLDSTKSNAGTVGEVKYGSGPLMVHEQWGRSGLTLESLDLFGPPAVDPGGAVYIQVTRANWAGGKHSFATGRPIDVVTID